MVDSKENYKFDLGVKGLNKTDQNARDRRQIFSTFFLINNEDDAERFLRAVGVTF